MIIIQSGRLFCQEISVRSEEQRRETQRQVEPDQPDQSKLPKRLW